MCATERTSRSDRVKLTVDEPIMPRKHCMHLHLIKIRLPDGGIVRDQRLESLQLLLIASSIDNMIQ